MPGPPTLDELHTTLLPCKTHQTHGRLKPLDAARRALLPSCVTQQACSTVSATPMRVSGTRRLRRFCTWPQCPQPAWCTRRASSSSACSAATVVSCLSSLS